MPSHNEGVVSLSSAIVARKIPVTKGATGEATGTALKRSIFLEESSE